MKNEYQYILKLDEIGEHLTYKKFELYKCDNLTDIGSAYNKYKKELVDNKKVFTEPMKNRKIRLYCLDTYTYEIFDEYVIEDCTLKVKE